VKVQGFEVATFEEIRHGAAVPRSEAKDEEAHAGRSMLEWAEEVRERGQKLRFDLFPFQREWYSPEVSGAREVVWMKAAQVGMSAYAWRWAMRQCDVFGHRGIYFFPTQVHVQEFGDTRIEPSIRQSPFLLRRIPSHYITQKGLKQIGNGFLSLRGIQSATAVQSVDADVLVFDEYDLSDQANLDQAERRIAGARGAGRDPKLRRLGYPSIPGFGIHGQFVRSDQRIWHVKCPECDADPQPIEWSNVRWRNEPGGEVYRQGHDEFVDPGEVHEAWRACRSCDADLDRHPSGPLFEGEWVKRRPDARTVGFHVPRLIVPLTDLHELVVNSRATDPSKVENFYTLDLGLPYQSVESALTDEMLQAACAFGLEEAPYRYEGRLTVTMGVDVASARALTARVSEHLPDGTRRALYLGEPSDFNEVAELIERYRPHVVVVDSMPERRQARALAATYPGRVFLCQYDEDNPRAPAYRFDPRTNMITVHRTEAIDAMMDSIRQQRNAPLRHPPPRYFEQMKSPKRRTVEDARGRPKRVYVSTGTSGDDYAHAETYDLVGSEMWVQIQRMEADLRARAGESLADEDLGFKRPRLDEAGDDYEPGLGQWDQ
jgi:hypothetical protein